LPKPTEFFRPAPPQSRFFSHLGAGKNILWPSPPPVFRLGGPPPPPWAPAPPRPRKSNQAPPGIAFFRRVAPPVRNFNLFFFDPRSFKLPPLFFGGRPLAPPPPKLPFLFARFVTPPCLPLFVPPPFPSHHNGPPRMPGRPISFFTFPPRPFHWGEGFPGPEKSWFPPNIPNSPAPG